MPLNCVSGVRDLKDSLIMVECAQYLSAAESFVIVLQNKGLCLHNTHLCNIL